MKRYLLVNPFTAEAVYVEALYVTCEKYQFIFFIHDKDNNKIESAYYAQRNWDIRDIEYIDNK